MRIVFIATAPETACAFLSGQITFLMAHGHDVQTITSPIPAAMAGKIQLPGISHELKMSRSISPLADLRVLIRLRKLLKRLRPEVVHTHTPKAGLLGMIAASLACAPVRIYTVNGVPITTQRLWGRALLACTEWLSCSLATNVICVSRSVRRFLISNHLCSASKCTVLGDGGSHGVNLQQFDDTKRSPVAVNDTRKRCGIPGDALVVGFVGRIIPEKGIGELAKSWAVLREEFPDLRLLICGYREPNHVLDDTILESLQNDPRAHFTTSSISDMPAIYSAIDICVLPTYREGLPNVALEAAAMRVPIVATRVFGCVDCILPGVTGLLVEPRNSMALTRALRYLLEDSDLRRTMGIRARQFVARRFSEARICRMLLNEYESLCGSTSRHATIFDLPDPCSMPVLHKKRNVI